MFSEAKYLNQYELIKKLRAKYDEREDGEDKAKDKHEPWLTEVEMAKKHLIPRPPKCICGADYDRFKKDGDVIMARCPFCWHIRCFYTRWGKWGMSTISYKHQNLQENV